MPDAAFAILPFVAALALRDAIIDLAPKAAVALKWPNDLLIGDRKVAGILLEGHTSHGRSGVAIGFGVNCTDHPVGAGVLATDLQDCGFAIDAQTLFARLSTRLREEVLRLDATDAVPALLDRWRAHAYGMGRAATVRLLDREISGTFQSLAPDGRLVLRQANGQTETIAVGDVFFPANGTANKPAFEPEKAIL